MSSETLRRRRGAILVLAALAAIVLLGMAALTIDVGQVVVAGQTAQRVADAATLGAACKLPDENEAVLTASELVDANNAESAGYEVAFRAGEGDVEFWGPDETLPGFGELGPAAWGIRVTTHVDVEYAFASALGLEGVTVHRNCVVARLPVGGVPICPMWISYETEYLYGQEHNLLMADGPHYANIPGNFGWLEPLSGKTDFFELLRGYDISAETIAANYVEAGENMSGRTGLTTGKFRKALETAPDGLARLQRAQWEPWGSDDFDEFHDDNPRIMIVAMVKYVGGSGDNASFEIVQFGAFWLEDVESHGSPKSITGRFIRYQMPGVGGDALAAETGLWTNKIVR